MKTQHIEGGGTWKKLPSSAKFYFDLNYNVIELNSSEPPLKY